MKKVYWKTIMYLSVLAMALGFFTSVTGFYHQDYVMAYFGFGIMVAVCISWWVWVMLVIQVMINITNNAALGISDIRTNIKEVRQLFNEYKKIRNG